jgi:hypothetical protein
MRCCGGLLKLWQRYSQAKRRWRQAGKPVRQADEVREIYKETCRRCPEFRQRYGDGKGRCRKCGCFLSKFVGQPKRNKIEMATESCPLGNW